MLKIIINNQETDLGGLNSISLNYNPGIFEINGFEGSYSFPFTLPASPKNNKIFLFQNKVGSAFKQIIEHQAQLWHSGILMAEGLVKATKYGEKSISCNFYIDNGEVLKMMNSRKLPENDYGQNIAWQVKPEWSHLTDDFVIYPVHNRDYYKGTLYEGTTNPRSNYQNYYLDGELVGITGASPVAVTPFPLLWRILEKLFEGYGFNYSDDFFTEADKKRINIFNTNNLVENYTEYIDGYYLPKYRYPANFNIANHLPDILTTAFIKSIQAFFNVHFYIQNKNCKVLDRLALLREKTFDTIAATKTGDIGKTMTGESYSGLAFVMQRDQQDLNVSGLYDLANDEITETLIHPINLPNPRPYQIYMFKSGYAYHLRYVNYKDIDEESEIDAYIWHPHYLDFDEVRSHPNYCAQMGLYFGKKEFRIETGLTALPEIFFGEDPFAADHYVPKVLQQGNSGQHKEKSAFSLRLMIYNNVQNVEGEQWPHAVYKLNDDLSITAFWSYYQRWQEFLSWYYEAIKEEYEVEVKLSAAEIKSFDFSRKKLVKEELFFVKNIQVELTRTEVKPAKLTMIKAVL